MSFELNVVDMYSDILNIYGDIGNLKCIKKRCEWRGIKFNQKKYSVNHDMDFDYDDIDLILIGKVPQQNPKHLSRFIEAKTGFRKLY